MSAKKFEADSIGNESEVALGDWIDIGVYTKDSNDQDSLFYLEKHFIDQTEATISIEVGAKPSRAGIDPINKLIDRNTDDNLSNEILPSGFG